MSIPIGSTTTIYPGFLQENGTSNTNACGTPQATASYCAQAHYGNGAVVYTSCATPSQRATSCQTASQFTSCYSPQAHYGGSDGSVILKTTSCSTPSSCATACKTPNKSISSCTTACKTLDKSISSCTTACKTPNKSISSCTTACKTPDKISSANNFTACYAPEKHKGGSNEKTQIEQMLYSQLIDSRSIHAIDELTRKVYHHYIDQINIEDIGYNGIAHYDSIWNNIYLDEMEDWHEVRGGGYIYFHEVGHMIDDASSWFGNISNSKKYNFYDTLKSDLNNYIEKIKTLNNLTEEETCEYLSKWLQRNGHQKSGISDLMYGLSQGKIQGLYYRDKEYYTKESINTEAFAHFFEAGMQFTDEELNYIKKIFPNAYKAYQKMLEDILK